MSADWESRLRAHVDALAGGDAELGNYARANLDMVRAAFAGRGPDAPPGAAPAPGTGVRMVANISSAHVPAMCTASRNGDPRPYKNGYDLGKYRVGDAPPGEALKTREIVDDALPLPAGVPKADVYFGAMELNGTGIYFYGDFCLVLKSVDAQTRVLDRNSYDLVRAPLRDEIEQGNPAQWAHRRAERARAISGLWSRDRDAIGALKVLDALGLRRRRYATGQISDALRDDEDYVEILRIGSFGTRDLEEVRLSAADVAQEASIDDRRRVGPAPSAEALQWRHRRRVAERELRASPDSVPVRVVLTSGRIKG